MPSMPVRPEEHADVTPTSAELYSIGDAAKYCALFFMFVFSSLLMLVIHKDEEVREEGEGFCKAIIIERAEGPSDGDI